MNSTTLPPLKPRTTTNKIYGGGAMITNSNQNLNPTIQNGTTNNNNLISTAASKGGRNSASSNGIQVQQLYDNSNKSYYSTNNNGNSNKNNNTTNNGAKSPSGESLRSTKSINRQLINNSTTNLNQQSASIGGGLNSTSQQQRRNIQPMSPETAIKNYMQKLTSFEHHEIFNHPEVFFIGQNAKKIHGIIGGANNNGYDDENGSYKPVQHDHILYRFEVLKILGKGSFGQVLKCYDHKTGQYVALKIVRNEKRFHRQAQEEIRILDNLRKMDAENTLNIIHMIESFQFRNHICITFELLSMNLYELIKKNKFAGFSLQLVRKFTHSMLQCLEALNKVKIIHCDLKPEVSEILNK
jgi:dual specificity tyrosine-phosphorylation-regulated kinase 2/3/4